MFLGRKMINYLNEECSCVFYENKILGSFIVVQILISVSKHKKGHYKRERSMCKG